MTSDETALAADSAHAALSITETLAGDIGPRRPASRAERTAAQLLAGRLRAGGIEVELESFPAHASFGYVYGAVAALALAPALLPRRMQLARAAIGTAATGLLAAEGGLVHTPVSDLIARGESANVIASIEPRDGGAPTRTLCLVAHYDSSRGGLLFHRALAPRLPFVLRLAGAASAVGATEPILARTALGRRLLAASRIVNALALALVAERELRGRDTPGANDNASGAGAVVQLALELAERPLRSTRVVVLLAGAEEAGLLGMLAFLGQRETADWLFLNIDGVGARATLRYLPSEGVLRRWAADPALVRAAEALREGRPELGLEPADAPLGLTYDATAVLARGGRALTLVAGDAGRIPHYHQPSDTVANLDREGLARAVECARELIAAIDRGEADADWP